MKKILIFTLFLFLFSPVMAKTKVNVLKVYDGDSILASIDENIFRIRMIDIDCFEGSKNSHAKIQSQKYKISVDEVVKNGNLAGDILRKRLDNNSVYFEFKGVDKYSRALGYLFVGKKNINDEMLKTGYCFSYKN